MRPLSKADCADLGARILPSGQVSLIVWVEENDQRVRRSQRSVDPREPKSYPNDRRTVADARDRIDAFLARKLKAGTTVKGFWEEWTDPEHHRYAYKRNGRGKRKLQTIITNKRRTQKFVDAYPDIDLLAIDKRFIDRFMREHDVKAANLAGLDVMFSDALDAGLITDHPCHDLAQRYEQEGRERRENTRPPVPTIEQMTELLDYASHAPIPRSLWAWLMVGSDTGARGGELDAFKLRYLDLSNGCYRIEESYSEIVDEFDDPKTRAGKRTIGLSENSLAVLEEMSFQARRVGSPFLFIANTGEHWTHGLRRYWWERFCPVRGRTLRELAGGVSIYNATRHYWATQMLNVWMPESPTPISMLDVAEHFGHTDGGRLMLKTYVRKDTTRTVTRIKGALNARPTLLAAHRKAS